MSTTHGNDGRVLIGANVVGEIVSFTHTRTARTAEDSSQGDAAATHKFGKTEASGSLTCHSDPDDTNGQATLVEGTQVTLLLREKGTGPGLPQQSVPAMITSVGLTVEHEGINSTQFDYIRNGAQDNTAQV